VTQPLISGGTCQPGSISFGPLSAEATNQDFEAILIGDCSLSWSGAVSPTSAAGGENCGRRYSPASCSARRTTSSLIQNLAFVRSCSSKRSDHRDIAPPPCRAYPRSVDRCHGQGNTVAANTASSSMARSLDRGTCACNRGGVSHSVATPPRRSGSRRTPEAH
jgi:hypothetical protein